MTRPVQALYLATEYFSDMTIAVSAAVRDRMTRWGVKARKLTVIPNGVDLDRVALTRLAGDRSGPSSASAQPTTWSLLLGRLDKNKRFDLAIEAAASSLGPSAKVLVVGGGAERDHLEETARRCGVADYVIFAGERHDVAAVLSAADLLVASSRQETFGLCVLEALANGCPGAVHHLPGAGRHRGRVRAPSGAHRGHGQGDRREIGAGPPRHAAGAGGGQDEFGIAAVTARIDDLYERLAGRRSWRTAAGRLRRRARQESSAAGRVAPRPAGGDHS